MNTRHCHICSWAGRDGVELPGWCPRCRGRCVADVADLPELYRTLGAVMEPGAGGEDVRVGGSRTPPLPFRMDPANLRGPATAGQLAGPDQHGALSIATALWTTRQMIREVCDLPAENIGCGPGRTEDRVVVDARFLLAWLDRFAERAQPDELQAVVEVIGETRRRAWNTCGYSAHKVRLGPCPADLGQGQTCGEELWIDPVLADSVTCRACHTRWDRRYFLWLRRMAGDETEASA